MLKAVIAKGSSGITVLTSDGEAHQIHDEKVVSEIAKLIEERQKIGKRISEALQRGGVRSGEVEGWVVMDVEGWVEG